MIFKSIRRNYGLYEELLLAEIHLVNSIQISYFVNVNKIRDKNRSKTVDKISTSLLNESLNRFIPIDFAHDSGLRADKVANSYWSNVCWRMASCFPCVPINVRYAAKVSHVDFTQVPREETSIKNLSESASTDIVTPCIYDANVSNKSTYIQEIVGKIKYNGTEFSCTKTQIIIITVTYTRTFFRKILTRSSKCRFLLGYTTFSSRYNSREEPLFRVLKASRRALLREERRSRHAQTREEQYGPLNTVFQGKDFRDANAEFGRRLNIQGSRHARRCEKGFRRLRIAFGDSVQSKRGLPH